MSIIPVCRSPGPAEFKDDAKASASSASAAFEATSKHHPLLIGLLARQLGVAPAQIRDFELSLFDTQVHSLAIAASDAHSLSALGVDLSL